jgi:two-component system chemotaxis response regulator CheB
MIVAVVLTGMGQDGARGAKALAARGAAILTEAESSCVVYGMPRAVKEAGVRPQEAAIGDMAALIARTVGRG